MNGQSMFTRRQILQLGSLGVGGLSLPSLMRADAANKSTGITPAADACILIFLNGGPSHLDMWDMKPNAAKEIRGEFAPISSSLPGISVSEHLPRMAKQMHRGTLVRSMHHSVNNAHAAAVYCSLTGHDRGEIGGGTRPSDYPGPGCAMTLLRPTDESILSHVTLPYITKEGATGPPQPGFFGGFIGSQYDPMFVLKDPNAADFGIPELTLPNEVNGDRLAQRKQLLSSLQTAFPQIGQGRSLAGMDGFQRKALRMLTSEKTQAAFRIEQEAAAVRESYGRNIYGQSVLLARRLIEAGTRVVTLSWAPDANATWDTHGNNFKSLKDRLLPQLDSAVASLLDDLSQRGMLERTVVGVLGDFGRSPKVNANAGRDHWNFCYSLMMFGGGFRPGLVYGASDKIGAYPAKSPLVPGDIISTLYHQLGIQHDRLIYDNLKRPHRLVPDGNLVNDLIS